MAARGAAVGDSIMKTNVTFVLGYVAFVGCAFALIFAVDQLLNLVR